MSTDRKPNPNSVLKTLPEERQAEIAELLREKSLSDVRKHLADDGIKTSVTALSNFYSWWHLRRQLAQTEDSIKTLMEGLRQEQPELSEEALFNYGQRVFSMLALQQQSAEDWSRIQRVKQRESLVALEKQKFQRDSVELFIKWHANEKAKQILESTASNSEKIETLGKEIFGEDWN